MTLEQKYTRYYLNRGVTLHVFYVHDNPLVCGTREEWNAKIEEYYSYMPVDSLFRFRDWYVYHMDSPVLDLMSREKKTNLEDYDQITPDYQVAAELYFSAVERSLDTDSDKSALEAGVFPADWKPGENRVSSSPITQSDIDRMFLALDHGFGHLYHHACGLGGSTSTEIREICNEWYLANRQNQTSSPLEDAAETYKRLYTNKKCFSDFTTTSVKEELATFLKYWYWIQDTLKNTKIKNFTVWSDVVFWEELEYAIVGYSGFLFWRTPIYGYKTKGWYGVRGDNERVAWKHIKGDIFGWVKVK